MIVRALIRLATLAALATAGWWIARLLRGGRRPSARRRGPVTGSASPMVRDRVCNTFLPRSRALEARVDEVTHYFCSEDCRRRFLRESEPAPTA